jgi:hypothetical protein
MRDIQEALDALKADGLKLGDAWRRAHELAQDHEGEAAYDRLHALLHRIEGDQPNAGYWYRRAGETPFEGSLEDEVEQLIDRAKS